MRGHAACPLQQDVRRLCNNQIRGTDVLRRPERRKLYLFRCDLSSHAAMKMPTEQLVRIHTGLGCCKTSQRGSNSPSHRLYQPLPLPRLKKGGVAKPTVLRQSLFCTYIWLFPILLLFRQLLYQPFDIWLFGHFRFKSIWGVQ